MPYLLNVIYLLLILFTLPWFLWQAVTKKKYRRGYAAKFLGLVPRRGSDNTCLWFHAVSVGEVNLLLPLIRLIQKNRPDWQCVISTTTATGMELAKKKYPELTVFYCPLDFTWAVSAAMRRIRPDVLVLAELELWPNLLRAALRQGAKAAIINGRLSEHSFRGYRRIRPLIARLLRQIDLIAVQDETYAERFRLLGARGETVQVTGSMKYDGARTDRDNPATRRLASLAGFTGDDLVWLAGSTQEPEEAIVLELFRRLMAEFPQLRLVLVPRHPDRFDAVARLIDQSGIAWQRRTELEKEPGAAVQLSPQHKSQHAQQPRILLVDAVGELGAWWGAAQIAFVGGSFGRRGGQNMIEPAAYGAAVSFGPNTWNFSDVVHSMLAKNAAVQLADAADLERFVRRCLKEPQYAAELGRRAKSLVQSQLGATDRTFQLLDGTINLL
ncbi:MAG: 3-deoxy-D-manno-octulosonic acid transferase [Thermoguttaceae bacterium]